MKKLLSLVVVLILAISGAALAETETKTYVIGATPSPHAELLELQFASNASRRDAPNARWSP